MTPLKLVELERRPEHMSLYPTMDTVSEAIAFIEQQAPLTTPNEIFSSLMLYHNSLLKQLNDYPH